MEIIKVRAREALVCSDLHCPLISYAWLERLIRYGGKNKIKTLIIAGDIFNFDQISQYESLEDYSIGHEIEIAKRVMMRLARHFSRIYLVRGNHDERLMKKLDYNLSFSELIRSLAPAPQIYASDASHLLLISGARTYRIGHAEIYSPQRGKIASQLAHALGCSIIIGHSHNLALIPSQNGRHISIDCGCMADIKRLTYAKVRVNALPEMNNGFAHVRDGLARLISDHSF